MTIKPNASHQSLSETTVIIHASTEPTEMSLVTMGSKKISTCKLVEFIKYTHSAYINILLHSPSSPYYHFDI
jgi:hypothetical protein